MAALGTYTLAQLVAMVRTIIQAYTTKEVGTTEIEEALNLAQYGIFLQMPRDMKLFWYGEVKTLTVTTLDSTTGWLYGTKPTCWDVEGIKSRWVDGTQKYSQDAVKSSFKSFEENSTNQFQNTRLCYDVFGDKVLFAATTIPSPARTYTIYTIRQPTQMSISSVFDMPDPFADLVTITAAARVVAAANIDAKAKEAAMQMIALLERAAQEKAGLPLQSEVAQNAALAAVGYPNPSPSGGSHGTVPVQS